MLEVKLYLTILVLMIHHVSAIKYSSIPEEFNQLNSLDIVDILKFNSEKLNKTNIDVGEMFSNMNWMNILPKVFDMYHNHSRSVVDLSGECSEALAPFAYLLKLKLKDLTPAILGKILQSPAGKMLDSWGKVPERVLLGNLNWIGAYDECRDEEGMKYCMSQMNLFGLPAYTGFYGTCLPKQCSSSDVHQILQLLNLVLKGFVIFPPQGPTVCNEPLKYETGTIITIVLLGILACLCLFGTFLEILQDICLPADPPSYAMFTNNEEREQNVLEPVLINGVLPSHQEISSSSHHHENSIAAVRKPNVTRGNMFTRIFMCFSLATNIKTILSTKVPKGAIESINGIRTISMTWVILGHYYFVANITGHVANIVEVGSIVHRFSFMAIGNAFFSVDTFFLLGGLLVAYLTLKRMDKFSSMSWNKIISFWSKFYLHRFIRLTPSLAILIVVWNNLFPLMIRGPWALWMQQGAYYKNFQKPCNDYWWTNILYVNNFWPKSFGAECVEWTWYLANDMQFYSVTPLILLGMYYLNKRAGILKHVGPFLCICGLCAISFIVTGSIIGYYDLPTLQTANQLPGNPRGVRGGEFTDYVYGKPYTRIPPYLVGILLGYFFSRDLQLRNGISRRFVLLGGWIAAIVVALSCVYGSWHVYKEDGHFFTDAENVMYGTFSRCAFTMAVAWVIYACHYNAGGWINKFLSWRFWIPLSRLTFGAYLLHPLVLVYFYSSQQNSFVYQDNLTVFNFVSVTVISYSSAFIFALLVEYPVQNLEKIIFK